MVELQMAQVMLVEALLPAISLLHAGTAPLSAQPNARYRYDSHFGAVIYLFLRGVDPVAGGESAASTANALMPA